MRSTIALAVLFVVGPVVVLNQGQHPGWGRFWIALAIFAAIGVFLVRELRHDNQRDERDR